jgi:hypothetical protein
MSYHRPAVVIDGDKLEIRCTEEPDYRIPYTFIEALNEGVLFDRSARVFKEAARDHRLFEIINPRTTNLIGTGVLQESTYNSRQQCEIGGLMIHPAACGLGLVTLLIKTIMVRELLTKRQGPIDEEYIAHVVDGNRGPIHAFLRCGFRAAGDVILHPGDFDGAMGHMIEEGATGVLMHSYIFDPKSFETLALDLYNFVNRDHALIQRQPGLRIKVDLHALLDFKELESYVTALKSARTNEE